MIVFATSDKGGTGRSVTSCNLAYRLAAQGRRVAYLDFDFGSPTAGALFELIGIERGIPPEVDPRTEAQHGRGLHAYLLGTRGTATRLDVREKSDRDELRRIRGYAGQLVLYPGDYGGAEFDRKDDAGMVARCVELLCDVERDFDVTIVDLSAGRSIAMELALAATAQSPLNAQVVRWLVFHRWTRQHIWAASGLVHGPHGLLECARRLGHDRETVLANTRFVRTAVPAVQRVSAGSAAQAAWLLQLDRNLHELAGQLQVGASWVVGTIPVEPVLQWREQLILDVDVQNEIAERETVEQFEKLAAALIDDRIWSPVD